MTDLAENAERALRMVREASLLSYDVETTGLDWKIHSTVGYVIGAPGNGTLRLDDVVYVPVRHGGGGNLPGARPMETPTKGFMLHPWEQDLAAAFRNRARGRVIGHNLKFDVHFSANAGVMLGRNLACTQNQEAMLDEYARSYSLEACAEKHGVTAKRGEELYRHLATVFGGAAERNQMANFWRLPGTDSIAYNYAVGDGVTTYELYLKQRKQIAEEEMELVAALENDLIWTVFRMERRGIKIDLDRVAMLRSATEARIRKMLEDFPLGFNVRSPVAMRKAMEEAGYTDWPKTDKGNPSFTERWLKKNPLGQSVIAIRQASNLINSFVNPLEEKHVFKGRVHATLNQLKSDDKGTISGRFSCNDPNLQQVPKRVKDVAKPFRRLFVADEGHVFWERDASQCIVAGAKVMVPGGTKNIEDMRIGDLVYSYDANRQLVLRKVIWAGKTGHREVVRLKWRTNGRTEGHLDLTADHPVRLVSGEYMTPEQMARGEAPQGKRGQTPYWIPVMALRRGEQRAGAGNYLATYLYSTGKERVKESRFVFESINGWSPEHVHHQDKNSLNNTPDNLIGITRQEHGALHNHAITHIVPLSGPQDVYDITVEGTHNFIANEICVHNCEPRLFAHYSQDPSLLAGYNAEPFVDAHQVVADLLGVERDPTAKRMNMGIFTGMQVSAFAGHMGWDEQRASEAWHAWFQAFPGVRDFQQRAKLRLANRGYVKTLLGRRCRLEEKRFAYRGTSKIIQGSNADIIKWKLLEADRACEDNGDIVQVLMTVHDSFNGQFQDTPQARALFDDIMTQMAKVQEDPFNLTVPFEWEGGEGGDWCEATFGAEKEDVLNV
jgi:DNA polymerase I-like protein with 3'-5' exonuclease and polymerase domains